MDKSKEANTKTKEEMLENANANRERREGGCEIARMKLTKSTQERDER